MGRLARFIRFYTEEDDGNGGGKGVLKTVTGALLHVVDALAKPAKKFVATLEPIQDLHGQDAPYPSGGGVNLLPPNATDGTYTDKGITVKAENGVYTISGTASAQATILIPLQKSVDLSPSTNKICFLNNATYNNLSFGFCRENTQIHYRAMTSLNRVYSGWSDTGNENVDAVQISVQSGTAISGNMTISPVLMLASGTSVTSFAPYSNECPITGHTGANVVRTGKLYDTYTEGTVTPTNFSGVVEILPKHRIKIKGTTTGQVDKYLSQAFNGTGGTLELNVSQPMPYANSRFYIYDTTSSKSVFNLYGTTGTSGTFETVSGHSYRLGFLCPSSGYSFDMDFTATITDVSPTTIPITFPALGKNLFPVASATSSKAANIFQNYSLNVPAGTYHLSFKTNIPRTKNMTASCYSEDEESVTITITSSDSGETIVAPFAISKITWYVREETDITDIQFESGSSATTYEPYTTTAYGGTLTNEDGGWKLRVTKCYVDASTLINWFQEYVQSSNKYISYFRDKYLAPAGSMSKKNTANAMCSILGTDYSWNDMQSFNNVNACGVYRNSSWDYTRVYVCLNNSNITSKAEFETWLISNDFQLSYDIANPIEYTLTESQALTLLKGENNIWVDDSDSLELQYYAKAEETTP